MKSNCAQKYLETVAAGQFDINEANICCWRNNCSFCKATTKKDGVPQIDKAGLRFAAEMPGKGSLTPVVLKLEHVSESRGQLVRTDCWVHLRVPHSVGGGGARELPL